MVRELQDSSRPGLDAALRWGGFPSLIDQQDLQNRCRECTVVWELQDSSRPGYDAVLG